jgi:hypothetical protein
MRNFAFVIGLGLALAGPAMAASESAKMQGQDQNAPAPATAPAESAKMQGASQNGQQNGQIQSDRSTRQKVADSLRQAGFSDVKVMPESFLVRAKDKNGNQVMMVINPDSVAAVTEYNEQSNSATQNPDQTGKKSGATEK